PLSVTRTINSYFLYSTRPPPHLPSFPTRRSSDLDPAEVFAFRRGIGAGMVSVNNSTSGAEAHLPFGGNGRSGNGSRQSGRWVLEDRKSTRLNSSHRTISYAVFCLKKKK